MEAVHARSALHGVQVPGEAHGRAGWPVVPRPEVQPLATVPVPRADNRLRGPELQGALDRSLVCDRLAEGEDDRHTDAICLLVALEDLGAEGPARRQGVEPARDLDGAAAAPTRGGCHW